MGRFWKQGQSERKYLRDLGYFWLQLAAALSFCLIVFHAGTTWLDAAMADEAVYGAMVYLVGPSLAVACLFRSLVFYTRSFFADPADT